MESNFQIHKTAQVQDMRDECLTVFWGKLDPVL